MILLSCAHCHFALLYPSRLMGAMVACSHCKQKVRVPVSFSGERHRLDYVDECRQYPIAAAGNVARDSVAEPRSDGLR